MVRLLGHRSRLVTGMAIMASNMDSYDDQHSA
jgi:hypothetical protein